MPIPLLWQEFQCFSGRGPKHRKVPPVESEDAANSLALCKMHQACVGQIKPLVSVALKDRLDRANIIGG